MLKSFRYLLFPFSLLYALILWVRNKLYDWKIFRSVRFNFPVICVGNLAVGGTGKTPMVELLIRLLKDNYAIATLSRGYKRKTKGFAIAREYTTALEIGDEPMQFHRKFPEVLVTVSEERIVAIPQILHEAPATKVILLDDAFQHRQVDAGINILLTEYHNLYTRDFLLPAGDLRDIRQSAKRANMIVVTKCPGELTEAESLKIRKELNPTKDQAVFFTTIEYSRPYHLFTNEEKMLSSSTQVLLVVGIANPEPLKQFLANHSESYDMLRFSDHHVFSIDDLKEIRKQVERLDPNSRIILTTEKDGVRLLKFEQEIRDWPVYVIPVSHKFLFDGRSDFESRIISYIDQY